MHFPISYNQRHIQTISVVEIFLSRNKSKQKQLYGYKIFKRVYTCEYKKQPLYYWVDPETGFKSW